MSTIRGELFFFRSGYVWRLRERQLQRGYPALARRHWRGVPHHLDAAYEDASGNVWFFQGGPPERWRPVAPRPLLADVLPGTGDRYWVFDAERPISGPEPVRTLGLPVANIQAALRWRQNGVEKAYLLKSASYWSLDPQQSRVDRSDPTSMWEWEGVPVRVDAAFRDSQGESGSARGADPS